MSEYLAQTTAVPAPARKLGDALVGLADGLGEFDASAGTIRKLAASLAGLTPDRADTALRQLRQSRAIELVRRGDSATNTPARWRLVRVSPIFARNS